MVSNYTSFKFGKRKHERSILLVFLWFCCILKGNGWMLGIRRWHQWQDQQCCPHCQSVVIKPALLSRQGFVLCFTSAVYLPSLWLLGDSKGVHGEMEEQWVCWYTEAGSCEERAHTHTSLSESDAMVQTWKAAHNVLCTLLPHAVHIATKAQSYSNYLLRLL